MLGIAAFSIKQSEHAHSFASHTSGEIVISFSTANKVPRSSRKLTTRIDVLFDHRMDPLYEACIEATEEAIYNSMCQASTVSGINGVVSYGLPLEKMVEIMRRYNRHPRPGAMPPPPTPPEELATSKQRPDVLPGTQPHPRGAPLTKEGTLAEPPRSGPGLTPGPVTQKISKAEVLDRLGKSDAAAKAEPRPDKEKADRDKADRDKAEKDKADKKPEK